MDRRLILGGGGHRVAPGGRIRWLRSRRHRRLPTYRLPFPHDGRTYEATHPARIRAMSVCTEYIKVRNWEKWQTYRRDRGQPPWIKVHREVMRNPDWVALTDAQRGQLVAIWLLAADRDGVIPASRTLIRKLCFMDSDPPLEVFAEHGFIEYDVSVTPSRRHVDHAEAEAEAEEEVEYTVHKRTDDEWPSKPKKLNGSYQYPPPFERAWSEYPSRDGSNPKTGAYKAFRARVKDGDDPEDLIRAATHYRQDCDRREQTGTPYVQQAATFWGPSEPWREFIEPVSRNGSKAEHWAARL